MTRHVALFAYPDCQLLDVSGPWQVFASANALSPQPLYQLTLVADAARFLAVGAFVAVGTTLFPITAYSALIDLHVVTEVQHLDAAAEQC